jgi:glucosamine kinase
MTSAPKYIGIDGGGTKCRAVVYDSHFSELSSAIAGPANVAKNDHKAFESMLDASAQALALLGTNLTETAAQLYVSAGLAGVNVPCAASSLVNWQHPFARFDFTTDIHSATLGAHDGSNGSVIIIGTGSCAAALNNGNITQFGGHGFNLGDKGSGAWIGKTALSKILESFDGVGQATQLREHLCEALQLTQPSQFVEIYNQAPSTKYAALAPLVLKSAEQGDELALKIVQQGANYLSAIAEKAMAISGKKLVLVGGLSHAMLPWLSQDVNACVIDPIHSPERGAVIYQQNLLN